jgi:hypothetical protein
VQKHEPLSESEKITRARGVAQMVEYLPRKCEALSLNNSTAQKKKKKREREIVIKSYHSE